MPNLVWYMPLQCLSSRLPFWLFSLGFCYFHQMFFKFCIVIEDKAEIEEEVAQKI